MGRAGVVAMLTLVTLAGCAGGGGEGSGSQTSSSLEPPPLEATATTGVIRGVVVDEAIRPLSNATITASGPGEERSAASDENGFFGFQGLEPGTWFVKATKIAHTDAQQSVEVVAGVGDPPVAKLQLQFLPSEAPFAVVLKYEGFVECAVPGGNLCFVLNFYPCLVMQLAGQACFGNITNDNSVFQIHDQIMSLQRTPDWTQMELVWTSTQSVTDWLRIRVSANSPDDGASVDQRQLTRTGPSPLMASLNASTNEEWELGTLEGLALESFAAGNEALCGLPNVGVNPCQGIVLQQRVDFFFHFFLGYTPPEGWRFSSDGEAPPPR